MMWKSQFTCVNLKNRKGIHVKQGLKQKFHFIEQQVHNNLLSQESLEFHEHMCNLRFSEHCWLRLISSDVVSCSVVICYLLGGACCLYFQGDQRHAWPQMMGVASSSKTLVKKKITNQCDVIPQKTVINFWKCILFL